MVHQLPGTFIAQLCSVLFAVTALTRRERHLSWLSLDWENTSLRIFRQSLHCLFHSVVIQRSLWDEHWDFPLCLLELHQEYWSLVISFKKHHKLIGMNIFTFGTPLTDNWQIAAANRDLLVLFPTQFYLWSLLDKFWMIHSCFWFSVSVQPLSSSCWLDMAAAFLLDKQGKQCQSKAFSLVHLRQHGHMCIHPLHYCHLMVAVNYCVSCVHF